MTATSQSPPLTRRRKATMIVQALIASGHKLALDQWPEEAQLALARELGSLRVIDRDSLDRAAEDFIKDLDHVALTAPGGTEAAVAALNGRISANAAARLREDLVRAQGGDPWSQVLALPVAQIVPILESEAVEVSAVVLSKLSVAVASEVLGQMNGDRARRVTLAMARTAAIAPATVSRIGAALAHEHCSHPATAFATPPAQRLGAILNNAPAATRNFVVDHIADSDAEFDAALRKAIFTFADIPARIAPADAPKIIRKVEPQVLSTAFAAAMAEAGPLAAAAEHLLANISKRIGEQIREDASQRGKVKLAEGEAAMSAVVGAIRELETDGDLKLVEPEPEA